MFARLLALSLGLCAGLAASQAPEYAQQYRQRLGGAIDELRLVVARFDQTAEAGRQADAPAGLRTEFADRLGRLERQRADFAAAGSFDRLLVLVREADPAIARAAYLDFEPAWPATSEGIVTGGIGFVAGWGVLLILFGSLGRIWPGRPLRASARLRSA